MKTLLLLFATFLIFSSANEGNAQIASNKVSAAQLGSRTVKIPAPTGFFDVVPRFDQITSRFVVTESPNNEVLAVFVPDTYLAELTKGASPTFDLYAKVSISKRLKTADVTPEDFKAVVESSEQQSPALLDPDGPQWKSFVEHSKKGLDDLYGQDTGIDMSQPRNLGVFDRRQNIYSFLMIVKLTSPEASYPMIGGISFVRVNNRLLFVYTYKKFVSDKDLDELRAITKRWTSAIAAANK